MSESHDVSGPTPKSRPFSVPGPVHANRTRSSRRSGMLTLLAAAVAVGGIAFAVGRVSAPAGSESGSSRAGVASGSAGTAGTADTGSMIVTGTVDSIDGSTMTIRTTNGSTVTVSVGGATTYHAQAAASTANITSGSNVQVLLQGAAATSSAAPAASPGQIPLTAADVTLTSP